MRAVDENLIGNKGMLEVADAQRKRLPCIGADEDAHPDKIIGIELGLRPSAVKFDQPGTVVEARIGPTLPVAGISAEMITEGMTRSLMSLCARSGISFVR